MRKQWTDIDVELALTRIKISKLSREYDRLKKANNPKMWLVTREIYHANKLAIAIMKTIKEAEEADGLHPDPE